MVTSKVIDNVPIKVVEVIVIKKMIVIFGLALFGSCVMDKGAIKVSGLGQKVLGAKTQMDKVSLSSVSISNNQLILSGSGFSGAQKLSVKGDSSEEIFSIESITDSKIIANATKAISFKAQEILNLVLSDAYGAATFPITLDVADGTITAAKLHHMNANDGDVLIFNDAAKKWGPRPLSGLSYKGVWDASTDVEPSLAPFAGDYWVTSVSGTITFEGSINFSAGDWIIYSGTEWQKVVNTSDVVSFNGRQGAVVAIEGDYSLDQLSDVDTSSTPPSSGQVLKWDGVKWAPAADSTGVAAGSVTSGDLTDNSIMDADINSAANIAQSKIQNLTSDLASKLSLSGGTLSGALDMGGNNIGNVGTVDGVDVSALSTSVTANAGNISSLQSKNAEAMNTACGDGQILQASSGNFVCATPSSSPSLWSNSGSDIYFSSGNVGIGTTTPTEKLEVVGNVKVSTLSGVGTRCLQTDANGIISANASACGASGGSGTVTSITAGTGLTGGTITTTGTIAVDVGTTSGKIPQLDGSGRLPSSVETDPSVSAFAKTSLPTCSVGEVLKSDGTSFSCVADIDTDTNTTYSAGTGLGLSGTTFSIGAQGIQDTNLSGLSSSCGNGQILKTNGLGSFSCGDLQWGENGSDLYFGNSVTLGGTTPDGSALLDLQSTTQGFLPPRMTEVERDAIVSPANGLVIYNTTNNILEYYNGTSWISNTEGAFTWTDVTSTRALGTTYTNTTGKILFVNVRTTGTSQYGNFDGYIDGSLVVQGMQAPIASAVASIHLIVPAGATYRIVGTSLSMSGSNAWWEGAGSFGGGGSLVADSVDSSHIQNNAVTTTEILDGTITSSDIASNTITVDNVDFASSSGINIPALSSDPGSGTSGQIYYNSTSKTFKFFDGTSWQALGTGGAGGASAAAWVSFNNIGTVTGSYNVSSVSRDSTGRFTINFTTAFSDTNYAVVSGAINTGNNDGGWVSVDTNAGGKSTSNLKIITYSNAGSVQDYTETYLAVYHSDFNGMGGSADNLGNHVATQDINLGVNKLVGNGGSEGIAISANGRVGIGTTSPRSTLDVQSGSISGAPSGTDAGVGPIDFSLSNIRYTSNDCGSFALHHLKDGSSYTFVVKGGTAATCSFTGFSDAGSSALTVHMPPDNGNTTSGKHSIYSLIVAGADVYVAWVSGY